MLRARRLRYQTGGRCLVDDVDFSLQAGELHALLGPNGAGKSSLLKLLSGEWIPDSGQVELDDVPLARISALSLARKRAVLPQADSLRFGFTAEQVVELGRHPCLKHGPEREREIVLAALESTGTLSLRDRRYPSLSGGERARVQFARVMAQIWEPQDEGARYLLLDEPTANLDLAHQHDCLAIARQFAAAGVGVLAILHDPNLALLYADRVSLMHQGRVLACGTPADTLTPERMQEVFGIRVYLGSIGDPPRPMLAAEPRMAREGRSGLHGSTIDEARERQIGR
jgi:iron complex transport system ATP-binding protein